MTPDEIKFLFDYDRWATRRIFAQLDGFDPEIFDFRSQEHMPFWRRHLVEEPQGWGPDGEAGSVHRKD